MEKGKGGSGVEKKGGARMRNKGVVKPSNYVDSTLFNCCLPTHAARYNGGNQ
jgi:hypothetical protein